MATYMMLSFLTHQLKIFVTIKSSLQAASSSVTASSCTPATLRPADALGALGELGALGRARVSPREQATTLTRLTSQWHERRAHALEERERSYYSRIMNVILTNCSHKITQTGQSYLLQSHAPHTVLPTSIGASGAQTEAAVIETVTRWRARHRGRRLHLHG